MERVALISRGEVPMSSWYIPVSIFHADDASLKEAKSAVLTVSVTTSVSPGFKAFVLAKAFSSLAGLLIFLLLGAAS